MNERRLRRALAEAVPPDPAARDRAWKLVEAAYAEHEPIRRWRRSWPVTALAT
ncbi:MAG: hypothetical protein QOG68_831, partial [Solirubrobacteraceae bacterium]|nr:hypothetical protein [Solirubrobacteraceae bacterium]